MRNQNRGASAPAHTTMQNIRFGALLLFIVVFVACWWLFSIRNGYYAAFVDFTEENVTLSLENANNRQRTEEDRELLAPLQSEFDSWRTRHLSEDIYAESADGTALHGRFYDCGYDKTVIYLPGFGETAEGDFLYAPFYEAMGYNLLLTDPRCAGQSEGEHLTYGLLERQDAAAWCREMTRRAHGEALILHGYGMGGAAALMAAGDGLLEDTAVTLLVAESVYDSLEELAHYEMKAWFGLPSFPFLNLIEGRMARQAGFTPADITVSQWVENMRLPAVFIAGGSDGYIPQAFTQAVYEACGSEKEWISVPDAAWGMCYPLAGDRIREAIRTYATNN